MTSVGFLSSSTTKATGCSFTQGRCGLEFHRRGCPQWPTTPGRGEGPAQRCRREVVMMPEGPEVKTMADCLSGYEGWSLTAVEVLSGRYQSGEPPQGLADFCAELPVVVKEVKAKGKLLYFRCEGGANLYFTLGMTGSFHFGRPRKFSRIALSFRAGRETSQLFFRDQRNFGTVTFHLTEDLLEEKLRKIGDSFLHGISEERFVELLEQQKKRKSSRSLAVFLMDQSRTSGVGNYILSECLYRGRLFPWITVGELSDSQCRELYGHITAIMKMSYEAQKGLPFERGTIHQYLQVYGRREDLEGREVVRAEGPHKRSVWYVPELQTPP